MHNVITIDDVRVRWVVDVRVVWVDAHAELGEVARAAGLALSLWCYSLVSNTR